MNKGPSGRLLVFILVTISLIGGPQLAMSQQQGDAPLFEREGIESALIASASFDRNDLVTGTLVLEHWVIPPGGAFLGASSESPEIYLTEVGAVSVIDSFGLGSELGEGDAIALAPNAEYEVVNDGAAEARLLKAYLRDDNASAATPMAEPYATPAIAADAQITTTILTETSVSAMGDGSLTLFVGSVDLTGGSSTGEQAHSGPFSVYVTSGTISLVSPSGLEGTVSTGQAVGLPDESVLSIRSSDGPAAIIVIGLASGPIPSFTEIEPAPTPTPEPSPTPEPTPVPEPTAVPSPTPEPTPDPAIEQGVHDWLDNYAGLRSACDSFAIADLYADPGSDDWNAVQGSLPCTHHDDVHFSFLDDVQIRIVDPYATVGFTWMEERFSAVGGCSVHEQSTVIELERIDGVWHPVDEKTFGTSNTSNQRYDKECQELPRS